ncbi:MAG TPA: peptidylprolyl isomerase [Mariprofundaceae bacterium]|nr:peptidylprolyl isomerase [Mariprofundaceae bacterium]
MIRGLMIAICLLSATACQQQTSKPEAPQATSPVVAKVGGVAIHESDIDTEMELLPEELRHLKSDPEARKRVLASLIRRQVLSQKAEELGLDTDPRVHQRIERARNSILIQAVEDWQMTNLKTPTEAEIKQYYDTHRDEFTVPEQIHARHILVATEEQAQQILKLLKRPNADFAALAAQYSLDDSNKSRGGDLNWFSRGMMVKSFEDAAFALQNPGDRTGPVKTEFGWHIIELLGKRPASLKSLDEAREEIYNSLVEAQLNAWIDDLTSHASVHILLPAYANSEKLKLQPEPITNP